MKKQDKKLPPGAGWLIGGIIGIAYMVLILFFEPDLLVPIGIGGCLVCAWSIGFALEGLNQKPLTPKQKKMTRWSVIIGIIILVIAFLLGVIFFLR
jgi:Na+-transporting methylmalonyl-CoA/oxaloacetate decarboxylase beta subunit